MNKEDIFRLIELKIRQFEATGDEDYKEIIGDDINTLITKLSKVKDLNRLYNKEDKNLMELILNELKDLNKKISSWRNL